jgi:hypothetical protein
MNTKMKSVLTISAATIGLGMVLLLSTPCWSQSPGPNNNNPTLGSRRTPQPREVDPTQMDGVGVGNPIYNEKRLQMMNAAQHQSMVADTERLVKLVADLNAQINGSKANSLTPDQMKMVAEIEKLAHSVRDKMRMTVRSASNIDVNSPVAPFVPR